MTKLHPLLRSTIAVVLGIVISFFVIILAESLNEKFYPSKHLSPTIEQMTDEIKSLPTQAFLLILLGYIVSSFFGGYVASRLSLSQHKFMAGLTVGFVLLLGGIVNFITIPHPIWLSISASASFMIFSFLGAKLGGAGAKQ